MKRERPQREREHMAQHHDSHRNLLGNLATRTRRGERGIPQRFLLQTIHQLLAASRWQLDGNRKFYPRRTFPTKIAQSAWRWSE